MANTRWQNIWTPNGSRETSDLGWEIRKRGGQFDLYHLVDNAWLGLFNTLTMAKDAADMQELEARRAEWGTGDAAHRLIDGPGGSWDTNVAAQLAEGHDAARISSARVIADELPDGPTVCVPVEVVVRGEYLHYEYILIGAAAAKTEHAACEQFSAAYLSFAEAEIARVPDVTDTLEGRAMVRELHKFHPHYDPAKAKKTKNPWLRSIGDPLDYVRKHTNI
jgi:hypothetical protein